MEEENKKELIRYIEEELLKFYNMEGLNITYSDIQGIAMFKAREILNYVLKGCD